MEIICQKSKNIAMNTSDALTICLNREKQITELKYLGYIITNNAGGGGRLQCRLPAKNSSGVALSAIQCCPRWLTWSAIDSGRLGCEDHNTRQTVQGVNQVSTKRIKHM